MPVSDKPILPAWSGPDFPSIAETPTLYLRYDNGKLMQQWFCRTRTRQWHEWREVPGQ